MSTIIGYNKDGVAISDKSQTAGKEIIIPIKKDGTVMAWKRKSETLDKEYNFVDTISLTYIYKNIYFNSPSFRGDRALMMFPTEFKDMLQNATIIRGTIHGRFSFICRSGSIGVKYLGEV